MATIKPLEGRTVHQIQSGQVIVDLCSVAKELVENSLDASATSIEVRFKNHGLESIEVQDNGLGISKENYETIALKHYTSKLSSYDELTSLKTYGFRGEALSSLCALSKFQILTAQADEAPKGTRLDFEISGKLKSTQVAPSPRGTTVAVENLFMNLPVRRRELEKNIKREYGKVLGVLQAYACISTNIKFSVSNVLAKGKRVIVFATRSNPTTRENIANVYGAKALAGLVSMNLSLEMRFSGTHIQGLRPQTGSEEKQVHVLGHVSRPIFGEGRQAPDRQMFFVNSRPCGLPQVAKVFNEVYKSYNISQSPFIFANITLNTNAYDVNVSPDKRTILLHDQNILLESLKQSLTDLFERQDQTVPQSQRNTSRLPSFKPLIISREPHNAEGVEIRSAKDTPEKLTDSSPDASEDEGSLDSIQADMVNEKTPCLIENFVGRGTRERVQMISKSSASGKLSNAVSKSKQKLVNKLGRVQDGLLRMPALDDDAQDGSDSLLDDIPRPIHDFNRRIAAQQLPAEQELLATKQMPLQSSPTEIHTGVNASSGIVQNAFDRMRPKRTTAEVATITIGSKTTTAIIGSSASKRGRICQTHVDESASESPEDGPSTELFGSNMRLFAAPGSQPPHSKYRKSDVLHPPQRLEYENKNSLQREQSVENDTPEVAIDHRGGAGTGQDDTFEVAGDELLTPLESAGDESGSDGEFVNEERKKSREDAKVAELIHQAEKKLATPSEGSIKRAQKLLRRGGHKDSTTQLLQIIRCSVDRIDTQIQKLEELVHCSPRAKGRVEPDTFTEDDSAEERLSLTVCKEDFSRMHIVGQFNLGFILAFRPSRSTPDDCAISTSDDELFIIDQHASDEKFNFERLQSSTIVQNQPLVKPHILDLTAIEEEIINESNDILLKNGFVVTIDTSGDEPVGRRCKLLSLPMSREVTFDTADLEELIALLADSPSLPSDMRGYLSTSPSKSAKSSIPRPSKVRRLFAMRACRSSVMIGKSLSQAQMERLVRHMGQIDKPWNCPHGRPTMRHVLGLGSWEGWMEGMEDEGAGGTRPEQVDWKGWIERMKMAQGGEGNQYGTGNEDVEQKDAEEEGTEDEVGEGDESDEIGDEDDETGDEDEDGDADDDPEGEDEEVEMRI